MSRIFAMGDLHLSFAPGTAIAGIVIGGFGFKFSGTGVHHLIGSLYITRVVCRPSSIAGNATCQFITGKIPNIYYAYNLYNIMKTCGKYYITTH